MKNITAVLIIILFCSFTTGITIFDFTVTAPDGTEQSLNIFQGKPVMIVILPSEQNDSNTTMLTLLGSVQQELKDSLAVIGIPGYEYGYADDSIVSIMSWYHSVLDSSFVITQGMNMQKASPYQSGLFHYLTNAEENGHFDQDVMGAGEKFIVSKEGILHGLINPEADYNAQIIEQILNSIE